MGFFSFTFSLILIDLFHQEYAPIMSITIPVSVKVATLVMIVMLKSTSVSPPLAFAVSWWVTPSRNEH